MNWKQIQLTITEGKLTAAAAYDATGIPVDLAKLGKLPDAIANINLAAMAEIDALRKSLAETENAFASYRNVAESAAKDAISVIRDPSVSDADTVARVAEITTHVLQTPMDREREAIAAQMEELKAKLAALA